jgi:hypothetical protein
MKMMMNTLNPPTTGSDPTTMLAPDEAVQMLRTMRDRIPIPDDSRIPHTKFNLGGVDPQFVTASINAIGAVDAVQTSVGRTDEEVRQEVETAARWNRLYRRTADHARGGDPGRSRAPAERQSRRTADVQHLPAARA